MSLFSRQRLAEGTDSHLGSPTVFYQLGPRVISDRTDVAIDAYHSVRSLQTTAHTYFWERAINGDGFLCKHVAVHALQKYIKYKRTTTLFSLPAIDAVLADSRLFFHLIELVSGIIGSIRRRDGLGTLIIDIVTEGSVSNWERHSMEKEQSILGKHRRLLRPIDGDLIDDGQRSIVAVLMSKYATIGTRCKRKITFVDVLKI